MGIEMLATGALLGATGLAGSAMQSSAISNANESNVAMQKFINEKNEALTREAWGRDDNAVQRRKADLRAAGINPNLAAGSAAATAQPARMEAAHVQANTAWGEGIQRMGGMATTLAGMDASMAQTQLTRSMNDTEKAKYVSEIAKSEKDMATAANQLANAGFRKQATRIVKKDADLWTGKNIDVRDRDSVTKVMKAFPNAAKAAKKVVGEKFPALQPYLEEG